MTEAKCLIHLVGSVPLATFEDVLSTTASILGSRARRLSGGEIGRTAGWINSHYRIFERHPSFEEYVHVERFDPRTSEIKRRRFRLKSDAKVPSVESFGPLGYAQDAADIYSILSGMKRAGGVAPATRVLVSIPAPYDILNLTLSKDDFQTIRPIYESALIKEIERIIEAIPSDELAIQWDAAHEFEYLATSSPVFNHMSRQDVVAQLVRLGDGVPAKVELGYHCCYGNLNLRHFVEPIDMSDMVDVMNQVMTGLTRPVQFVHMPVPIDRTDDAYFTPLRDLRRSQGMELYLGLAHDRGGVAGTVNRAVVAKKVVANFGISTECGLGMRTPENVVQLLQIQAEAAAEIDRAFE
jgi:methionine synthase II (cobalamin-independent)